MAARYWNLFNLLAAQATDLPIIGEQPAIKILFGPAIFSKALASQGLVTAAAFYLGAWTRGLN